MPHIRGRTFPRGTPFLNMTKPCCGSAWGGWGGGGVSLDIPSQWDPEPGPEVPDNGTAPQRASRGNGVEGFPSLDFPPRRGSEGKTMRKAAKDRENNKTEKPKEA